MNSSDAPAAEDVAANTSRDELFAFAEGEFVAVTEFEVMGLVGAAYGLIEGAVVLGHGGAAGGVGGVGVREDF